MKNTIIFSGKFHTESKKEAGIFIEFERFSRPNNISDLPFFVEHITQDGHFQNLLGLENG